MRSSLPYYPTNYRTLLSVLCAASLPLPGGWVTVTLAFTRYFCYQYCTVYGIQKGGRGGGRKSPISRAIVWQQCSQCALLLY